MDQYSELEACPECFRMPFDAEPHGPSCPRGASVIVYTVGFIAACGTRNFVSSYVQPRTADQAMLTPFGTVSYGPFPSIAWTFPTRRGAERLAEKLPTAGELPSRWLVWAGRLQFA